MTQVSTCCILTVSIVLIQLTNLTLTETAGKECTDMILIDGRDHRPIYEQIVEKLSELMILGGLENGAPVPSVRQLASELSVTPNTVQRAYAELERLGYIVSIRGKGSFVADTESIRRLQKEKIRSELSELAEKAARAGIDRQELAELLKELPPDGRQTGGKDD